MLKLVEFESSRKIVNRRLRNVAGGGVQKKTLSLDAKTAFLLSGPHLYTVRVRT